MDTVLHVKIREEDGSYWATVEELPGCIASGFTLDEVWEAIQEAARLVLPDHPELMAWRPSRHRPTIKLEHEKTLLPA